MLQRYFREFNGVSGRPGTFQVVTGGRRGFQMRFRGSQGVSKVSQWDFRRSQEFIRDVLMEFWEFLGGITEFQGRFRW